MKLKGHETFAIREGWLGKGLHAVQKDSAVFSKNQGADALGVGTNMAKAIRYWLKAGGWIQEIPRKGAYLTELGTLLATWDPYLEDSLTLWLFHAHLVCNEEMATSWYVFFQELEAEEFDKEELYVMLRQFLQKRPDVETIPERSLRDDVTVLLHMYVQQTFDAAYDPEEKKQSPFAKLGLLRQSGTQYRRIQPQTDQPLLTICAYLIQRFFAQMEEKQTGVSIEQLEHGAGLPGRVCGLKRVGLNECLDRLSEKGQIVVNRTAGLDMVYPNSEQTPFEIIKEYYSE